jgi:ribose-phosphate pyrophosphokinase
MLGNAIKSVGGGVRPGVPIMLTDSPLLFALNGSQAYASRVAQRLGCRLAEHEERAFEDGEYKSRPLEPVIGRRILVFHALYGDAQQSVHDKLCRLLFFCAALKDDGARHVQVVTPYLCYARKECRTRPLDPISSRYVATLFQACGVDRLMALEVHNVAAFDNAFRIPTCRLECAELFAAHFAPWAATHAVVAVAPDFGAAKRTEQFRLALERLSGRTVASAQMEKHRSNQGLSGAQLSGEVRDKTAIIIDDMISTGSTLLRAGQACQAGGASTIFAAATHGLFIQAQALLDSPLFARIVITDSVPPLRLEPALAARRLQILDSSALLAEALAQEYALQAQWAAAQQPT